MQLPSSVTAGSFSYNTSLAVKGALAHHLQRAPPATPRCLLIQNGRWALEICQTLGYWIPKQLLLNKFFNSITPSMRTSKIQNDHQGTPKWPTGS